MSKSLDPIQQQQIAERLRYYRELGIHDFYRRGSAPATAVEAEDEVRESAAEPEMPKAKAAPSAPAVLNVLPESAATDPVEKLKLIREDIGDCVRCVLHQQGRKQIVFGVGNPKAELMFVGEAPGADEDEQGEPFVGRAGQLLTDMITKGMGLRRDDVYIANVIKCRPPGNRTPEREECDICSPFLMRQIDVIQPKVIVALGAVAAKTLLATNEPMAKLRGRWFDFRDTKLAVTYHPAYLLRDPRQKVETWKDLQMVMQYLGIPLPKKQAE